ncbi:MAG: hypothetical protein JO181_05765, partial [Solirubrobacterales bacterium]|nr:hypothetical protein [Solirubrobacterales bacterium]
MARKSSFGRDRGLEGRMLFTLFLIQYFTSDKIALLSMGAREVSPAQA